MPALRHAAPFRTHHHPARQRPAVAGEIVHDLDCKDDRYGRPEAAGVRLMIAELVQRIASDDERLTAGSALFESLYRGLASGR